jgi:hypothetical protein
MLLSGAPLKMTDRMVDFEDDTVEGQTLAQ